MAKGLVLALLCVSALAIWDEPKDIPRVSVNLDLPPSQRYTTLITDLVNTKGWEYTYEPVINFFNAEIPAPLQPLIEKVSLDLDRYVPAEYAEEMRGVANVAAALGYGDVFDLQMIVTLNLLYEWTTACTSIVAEDLSGTMWHARNMDWNFAGNSVYNITAMVDYTSKGKVVFTTVSWIGYVGVLSGVRTNGFTVTVDQRDFMEPQFMVGNMEAIEAGALPVSMLLRQALDTDADWNSAVNRLAGSYIAAPVYYIIGGYNKDEGAVITRGRFANETDIWKWGTDLVADQEPWYLIETNYDHWEPDPPTDPRRTYGINSLNAMTQAGISADNLFGILAGPKILNNGTQYSMVVNLRSGYFKAVGWQ